jgi:hypothetical protein
VLEDLNGLANLKTVRNQVDILKVANRAVIVAGFIVCGGAAFAADAAKEYKPEKVGTLLVFCKGSEEYLKHFNDKGRKEEEWQGYWAGVCVGELAAYWIKIREKYKCMPELENYGDLATIFMGYVKVIQEQEERTSYSVMEDALKLRYCSGKN